MDKFTAGFESVFNTYSAGQFIAVSLIAIMITMFLFAVIFVFINFTEGK